MDATRREIARDGLRLVCWEWAGPDPAALLLHGIGNYGRYWDLLAERVDGRVRLVAPDARGHGESARPPGAYRPGEYVADALAVADAFGLARCVLVGHSMGGTHAIRLAAEQPRRVSALLLLDVAPETMPAGAGRARRLTAERPERFAGAREALAYLRETSPGYAPEVYANRLRWAFRRAAGEGLEWRSSRDALLATMAARDPAAALWALLARVRCPLVLVRGTRSNVLDPRVAARVAATVPRGRVVEVEAGHNVALERPAEVAGLLIELTASARASGSERSSGPAT